MGYSEEQMNRAISEVLETSHNKEISSLWPSVLCLLREDEVYGFHMKSQSIRGILRATPSTHTLVNGDRDCVESESRLPNTSRDGGPTPRINSDKVASKSFTMGAPSSLLNFMQLRCYLDHTHQGSMCRARKPNGCICRLVVALKEQHKLGI
ncbi:hypothetical protein RchiOBHm_Chr2g0114761 [Rosa chinensis]|uniref:Uncharacterized protein n=1 Tax=Rosa chinensis TaxID=74649 RepID=A0A2P6RQW4_ROSCH|nr:uncharacterized protein LOC112186276 [Rosa chinensis]XP_040370087.1 uncharacterized protein LOC112186276 [Rosa chinensis]PRQ48797.1 hypothetical protein RchiOBHm_Chr2g0114761 [Rosa chinensis]